MNRNTFLTVLALLIGLNTTPLMANEYLLKHAQAVGQTMLALYMSSLSHGGEKYKRDLDFYKQVANETLQQYTDKQGSHASELSGAWAKIKDRIKLEYRKDFEWDPDEALRRDFRTYQSNLFQFISEQSAQYQTDVSKVFLAAAQVETLIGRFFDISTSYNGTISLSPIDAEKVDTKAVSAQFTQLMTEMIESDRTPQVKKQIKSALYKWQFVEDSVVNYSDASAHFLVYATKNKISKVLNQNQLVSAN
jgi:hypothetical protein